MKAIVDRGGCTGCGLCESICPEVFELNDEGIAVVLVDKIPAGSEECARQSEDECPVEAITVE